jgi:hypothetical protein
MNKSEIKIGKAVIFWRVVRKDGSKSEPVKTVITSDAWKLGRRVKDANYCCCVADVPRCVNIRNLEEITN